MKTTFLILTLLTIFISSADASELNVVPFTVLDNECYRVDPVSTETIYDGEMNSNVSLCNGWGEYSILRDQEEPSAISSLDYRGVQIDLDQSDSDLGYGDNVAWVIESNTQEPKALIYSVYTEVLIDKKSNLWEPEESLVIVGLKGKESCVIGTVVSSENDETQWSKAISIAQNISVNCISSVKH